MKRQKSITDVLLPVGVFAAILALWQILSVTEVVPAFMLPSPVKVIKAFIADFPTLMGHTGYTLLESAVGMAVSIITAFLCAVIMDRFV